jgi:hypothetical protein
MSRPPAFAYSGSGARGGHENGLKRSLVTVSEEDAASLSAMAVINPNECFS